MPWYGLGAEQLESREGSGGPGISRQTMAQQCTTVPTASWAVLGGVLPAGKGKGPLPLLSLPGPVLGSSVQRHGYIIELSPEQGHEGDEDTGAFPLC